MSKKWHPVILCHSSKSKLSNAKLIVLNSNFGNYLEDVMLEKESAKIETLSLRKMSTLPLKLNLIPLLSFKSKKHQLKYKQECNAWKKKNTQN